MGPLDLLLHLLNFLAPALGVALLLTGLARLIMKKQAAAPAWYAQTAINFVAGLVALAAGLAVFGRDGKMATYAVLVLACAASQWLAGRHWR
ncbi:MAG: hypothetical protein KF796_07705 [Ramlibacter sp.]|nr:hypothetical protein [Ramlibacter sp.]